MKGNRRKMTVRLVRLMALCHTRRTLPTLQDMARELGCCQKTVRRDLEAFEEAHIPVPPRLSGVQ